MKFQLLAASASVLLLSACGSQPAADAPASSDAATSDSAAMPAAPAPAPNPGKIAYVQCAACHKVEAGAPNGIGPNLAGIVGRKSAQAAGFKYSAAMKARNVTWDEASLDAFLKQPQKFVPGTSMAFPGIADDQRRADLIAYLKSPTP